MGLTERRQMATEAIHAGETHDPSGAHIAPIFQTSTFTFPDMAAVEARAVGESDSYMYSRGGNPGRKALAAKLAALEGLGLEDSSAEIFGSGMAAIAAALMGTAKAGDHIITQQVLYGSADHLISDVLTQFGVSNSRVAGLEPDALAAELELHPETTAVYMETPANPTMTLIDISATAETAHAAGAKVIVDNTFATPILQRPLSLGADVVVHSTTKFINGHGTVIGGAVVSTDETLMAEEIGSLIRFTGGVPSPFDCWLTNLGLKTLPLRMHQHCANGMAVAEFLQEHPAVASTSYPGLSSHPQHELAGRQMDGFGALIAFDMGSYDAATRFLDQLALCSLAVSLGNVDTLIEHPASMTHAVVPPEERAASGITDGLIRISVGLEASVDIVSDLEQALEA
ncbi:MAG TPA: aminotransferase class I/II-fold pyridoxal phosphate-dependent enzyme [Acidimicrobiales bacterium]|jgi:methionine-gamma-lyase|nr:aminotransferase class I/II-fold pyridoxal phosphate-dependent enzyme [Acidimicrobiales bacterium]MDP7209785.1 aminotransferase class I/II-fold pyridoxal phosphate-dependent enzyme [Acidimicrobiales bacterium]HJL89197.1 aminotransferase class I/II-fold pyridoxal phosphate-dependent enzyme [Acidimicrobiales bacterium]HJO99108.1 aminotransferase class I/II-fold pyridoxal phosphate-dependent enzyme [Acidimicrobiales bacterium]|tara:strand:+ start:3856 stop:5055 length:1200 start_codon:yes stop_codon:yes gene_type:complete